MADIGRVAMRIISKIPASAGAERSWSLFGDVQGGRHAATLGTEKARKLVFVRPQLMLTDEAIRPVAFRLMGSGSNIGSGPEDCRDDSDSDCSGGE